MLHILYADTLCYEVSVKHMYIVLDLILMVQRFFLIFFFTCELFTYYE